MKKIIIAESQAKNLIKILKEQNEGEYYEMTGKQYEELLKLASYNSKVTGIKKFGGKPLYVVGDVNLSGTPIKDLGNVAVITGRLNISSTQISSLGNTIVKGYVSDYNTPIEKMRIRREELAKLADADERRQDGEWDLDNPKIDDEGLAANALFDYLVYKGDLDEMDEETKNEIKTKKEEIERLIEEGKGLDMDSEEREEIYDRITDLQNEIEELQEGVADVYYLIPQSYRSYGDLNNFEVIGLRGQEYTVGYWDDVYEAAIENQEQLIEDIGIDGINQYLIEDNLDKDQIRDEMRDWYYDDVRENPDIYFDEDDYELTTEQEERQEQLENYINEMEELKSQKQEELEGTEDEDEIADLESEIEEIEDNIEKAQEELDGIEPDTEPSEEMIDEKVESIVRRTDPVDWLKELGRDLKEYVDIKGVATDIVDSDGLGVMASYDGRYDEQTVTTPDGKKYTFVIMRMN
jgi:predicted  nucleic acid-binding Zn-ribbon protein